jgi:hypothetical protein
VLVDYEIKPNEMVEGVCGPATLQVTCAKYRQLTGHPYQKPEYPRADGDGSCCEELLNAIQQLGLVEIDCEVLCGPQFGVQLYSHPINGGCLYFNPDTKSFEELDIVSNEMGKPASTLDDPTQIAGVSCFWENVTTSVCNDSATEDLTLTADDILALVTGEVFNNEGATPVDLTADGQTLLSATVNSWLQNSIVKKEDGDFNVTSAGACAVSVNGERFNLQSGGSHPLGDSHASMPNQPIVIDESVVIPCGSAVRFCFLVRYCEFEDGSPVVEKEGGGFVKGEKG